MKNERPPIEISYEDIEMAVGALDSYLDAFGEEPDRQDEMVRIRRAMEGFQFIVDRYRNPEPTPPPLKLIRGGKPVDGKP